MKDPPDRPKRPKRPRRPVHVVPLNTLTKPVRPERIVLQPTDDWTLIEAFWALDDIEERVGRLRRFLHKIVRRRRARKRSKS